METPTCNYLPGVSEGDAFRIGEILARWSQKHEGHVSERRKAKRFLCWRRIFLRLIPHRMEQGADRSCPQNEIRMEAWARNLSSKGISFLIPPELIPVVSSDSTPILSSDRVVRVGREAVVGLLVKPGSWIWVTAIITRIRQVHEGYLDCGACFTGRIPHLDEAPVACSVKGAAVSSMVPDPLGDRGSGRRS